MGCATDSRFVRTGLAPSICRHFVLDSPLLWSAYSCRPVHYSIPTNCHRPTPTPTQTLHQPRQAAAEKIIVSRIIEVGARSAAGRDTDWNARLGQHVVKRQTRFLSQERFLKPSEHRSSFFWLSATEGIYGSGGTRSRRFSQFDYTSHTSNEQCAA